MAVLLYYPLVKPPTEVLHQALLYWDGIASVVPREPEVYEAAVSAELKELRDRSLYRPLHFDDRSMELLYAPRYGRPDVGGNLAAEVLRQELRRMAGSPDRPSLPSPPEAFIYQSKLSRGLERDLLRLGLAERWEDDWWRLAVPKQVQELIIGVLARELALEGPVSYIPYTDRPDAYDCSLRAPAEQHLLAYETELGGLLPVPAPGTPTADVLAFRDRYADERQRLMRALHRLLGDLRRDYEHPADVLSQLRREIDQSVEDYRGAAKSSRMAWVERSVMVTVALGAAVGSMVEPGLTWVLGAVGGYALNVATREIRPLARSRDGHDFSYLHRVKKSLP
ncbi:hypothetical protein QQY66_40955 [Streptomyces sp. DG2A-72]|uniref:hypothetical protein n=1 Tax=Streptomyces sp. DG2A-72 TaxID=3051386 RepID=UPI00265C2829|nr:hypothetical protein [Streptomyces sp. DG2A-72]MDO0937787.1 hypothetical protein [Streptomyces sp. DG2A-72]